MNSFIAALTFLQREERVLGEVKQGSHGEWVSGKLRFEPKSIRPIKVLTLFLGHAASSKKWHVAMRGQGSKWWKADEEKLSCPGGTWIN